MEPTGPQTALLLRTDLSRERLFYVDIDDLVDLLAEHLEVDPDNPLGSALGMGLDEGLVLWVPLWDHPEPTALQPNISASFLYWGMQHHQIVPMFGAALLTGIPCRGRVHGLDTVQLDVLEDLITWGPARHIGDPALFAESLREIAAREGSLLQDRTAADRAVFGDRLS